jgi:hypothetical protein
MIHGTSDVEQSAWTPADDDVVVTRAATIRLVQLTTGKMVRFAPEALEGIIAQVETQFIPMNIEHLSYLPPIGRWQSGELTTAEDGEQELTLRGRYLRRLQPAGKDPDPLRYLEARVASAADAPASVAIDHVSLTGRTFEDDAFERAEADAPIRVEHEQRWS